jgi:DNA replicative helicase MCM subunit Mcm2 (Cdc46/Mcm family)
VLYVDYNDLVDYAEEQAGEAHRFAIKHLISRLLTKSTSTVEIFKKQINTLLKEIHAAITVSSSLDYETLATQIYIRFLNLDAAAATMEIGQVRPEHIGKFVFLDGVVSKMEKPLSFAVRFAYRCTKCNGISICSEFSDTIRSSGNDMCG